MMIFVSMMLLLLLIDTEVEFYVMMMPQPERNSLDSLAKSQGDALPKLLEPDAPGSCNHSSSSTESKVTT
jgi:hypothetical protein